MDCISCAVRCRTRRTSVFLVGIDRIQRICSSADGTLYSMYRMNDLIAASRMFLEPAPFPRVASRSFRKFIISVASICSTCNCDGEIFRLLLAYSKRSLKASA